MRAIIIILSALGAAILVMSLLKAWQMRKAAINGVSPDTIGNNYIIGAFVAVVVFATGVFFLELGSAPPESVYSPARIENGAVTGGRFDKK